MQARALIDFGEPSLNRAMRVYGPIGDLSVHAGRYYPSKAPLLSFAAAPVYWVLRTLAGGRIGSVPEIPLIFFSRLLLTVLPTLGSLLLLFRLLVTYTSRDIADVVVVFYALGTLAFSYSLQFLSHQTSATLLFVAFFLVWRGSRERTMNGWLVLAGFVTGLAVVAEYTTAMGAGLLGVYVLLARRTHASRRAVALALFAAGSVVPLALLAAYHTECFGGPLQTGYRHLADAAYQPWHLGGFLGIRTPDPRALFLSLFSPLRGLFMLSPGLLLGVLGLRGMWRARREASELAATTVFTALLILGYLYFTSSFSYESWGWTTGPRHMTGLVPFLLLPIALALQRASNPVVVGLSRGLLASSILITGLITLVNYVPDNVSEGLFGLAIPLARAGDLVPSVPVFLGLLNPFSGLFFVFAVFSLSVYVGFWRLPSEGRAIAAVLSAACLMGVLVIHEVTYRDTDGDKAARALLSEVWLAPAGVRPCFWCTSGRP